MYFDIVSVVKKNRRRLYVFGGFDMICKIEGELLGVGVSVFEGKEYPYFELLQRNPLKSEVVRISGNGGAEKDFGKKIVADCRVMVNDKGALKIKRIDGQVIQK